MRCGRTGTSGAGRSTRRAGWCARTCGSGALPGNDDLPYAFGLEDRGQALALIALQDERAALDGAAAAERVLQFFQPLVEVDVLELLDHGDLFPAAALSFHAHDGACGAFGL